MMARVRVALHDGKYSLDFLSFTEEKNAQYNEYVAVQ
jgi:hypothetical protein